MKKVNTFDFTGQQYEPFFDFWGQYKERYARGFSFRQNTFYQATEKSNSYQSSDFKVTRADLAKIHSFIGNEDAGTFLVIFSMLTGLLHRYTRENYVVIDTPLFHPLVKGEIHSRQVPLFVEVTPATTLKDHLRNCQDVLRTHYAFQNFPLQLLSPQHEAAYRSNILVRHESLHIREYDETQYDLVLDIRTVNDTLECSWRYNQNFESHFVGSIRGHLLQCISCLDKPDTPIGEIAILTHHEEKLIQQFNDTARDFPNTTIHQLIEESVRKYPDAVALYLNGRSLTYHELNAQANQLAHHLRTNFQVKPNDIIGLMVDRSERMIIAILAILKSGAAYLPLDTAYPSRRKEFILKDAEVKLLLTDSEWMLDLDFYSGQLYMLDIELGTLETSRENPEQVNTPDDLAYVIYTSGSTGEPKGVLIEHRSNVNMSLDQVRIFRIEPSDRVLQFASLSFDASVSEICMAFYTGAALVLIEKDTINNIHRFIDYIQSSKVSVVTFPPSYLAAFDPATLQSLRVIVTAGEAARVKDAGMYSRQSTYYNAYGPTECAVCATVEEVKAGFAASTSISIGKPIANMEVHILDQNLQYVPVGVVGEIAVAGVGLARGYLKRPALNEERFVKHPREQGQRLYKTGDLGKWLSDGRIEFLGRADYQVKIRGYRIEFSEIESRLLQHEAVKDAVVVARQDQDEVIHLVAYIVNRQDATAVAITEYLAQYLPAYMIPALIIPLKEFSFNESGKIDRKLLPDPFATANDVNRHVAPSSPLEKQLAAIWEMALNKKDIGITDDFFQLGGDSIKAIRLVSDLNRKLQVSVEVKDVFAHTTIRSLARVLEGEFGSTTIKEQYKLAVQQLEQQCKTILDDVHARQLLPGNWEDFYPMSDVQTGMLYYTVREKNAGLFHDQMFHQFEDATFDVNAFNLAVEYVVRKHAILRTSFHLSEFHFPLQVVHHFSPTQLDVEITDLTHLATAQQREFLTSYLHQDMLSSFVIEKSGLWRIRLFKLSDVEFGLLFICHHAIIDGWSDASLFTELSRMYVEMKENPAQAASPLKATYKDYIIDQIRIENNASIRRFWRDEMLGYNRTRLPLQKTIRAGLAGNDSYTFFIPAEISQAVTAYGIGHQLNPRNIFLAAFLYFVRVTTNTQDVTIGLTTNGRPEIEDGDKIIGCFLNTIPFRMNIEQVACDEFVRAVHEKSNQVKAFDKLSLQAIIEESGERSGSENPLFDIMFNYVDFHIREGQPASAVKSSMPIISGSGNTNTPFVCSIEHQAPFYKILLSTRKDTYTVQELERLRGYFTAAVETLITYGGKHIANGAIVSVQEREKLLTTFNDTDQELPADAILHRLFEQQVRSNPQKVALVFNEIQLTYGELNARANQLAHYLIETYKVVPNELVGICLDRSEWMIISILAVLKSGAGYVPIDPNYPQDRVKHILLQSGCRTWICENPGSKFDSLISQFDATDLRVVLKDILKQPIENPITAVTPSDLAYVIYTSGSTGVPKGVMIEHRGCVNTILDNISRFGITEEDTVMQFFAFTFDASILEIFYSYLSGATLVSSDESVVRDVDLYLDYIRDKRVSAIFLPPAFIGLIPANRLPYVKTFMSGGDQAGVTKSAELSQYFSFFNVYGPTECSIAASAYPVKPSDKDKLRLPIGFPMSNTKFYILDDALDLLPIGVEGNIYISGVGLSRGYVNDPALTSARFIDHVFIPGKKLYKTGDAGRWLADGNIEFLGRLDHQVKIRGYRIELGEIESVLEQSGLVHQCVVVTRQDSMNQKQLVGYVVAAGSAQSSDIKEHLRKHLPEYMVPAVVVVLASMPLTPNGKIDRRALPDADLTTTVSYVAPRNQTEQKLAAIWASLLDVKEADLSIHANFFEMGGHSLLAMRVVSAIRTVMGEEISIRELFQYPTLAQLADHISEQSGRELLPAVTAIPAGERPALIPLSYSQERMVFIDQLQGSTNYHIPVLLHLNGEIQYEAVAHALAQVMERHQVLRTVFTEVNGQWFQRVTPVSNDMLRYHTASFVGNQDQIKDFIQQQISTPFNLRTDGMLRADLIRLTPQAHLLLLVVHHIASDGWSQNILERELIEFYEAYTEKRPAKLNALQIQYADYALWQRRYLSGSLLEKKLRYWQDKLNAASPLNLPTDFTRPAIQSTRGAVYSFHIEQDLHQRLQQLSQQQGATLFMSLLTVFKVLLYRYTAQGDIVVGTPSAGRLQQETEDLIGFFVNTLVLRSALHEDQSFVELLGQVRDTTLEAYTHQDVPFEKIVERVERNRDMSRSPLFQVMFAASELSTQQAGTSVASSGTNGVHRSSVDYDTAQFDLSVTAMQQASGLTISISYCIDLFSQATIERMSTHFIELMRSALQSPSQKIGQLVLLTAQEEFQLVDGFNPKAESFDATHTVVSMIERQVDLSPHATALIIDDMQVTYQQLNEQANRIAHYLRGQGIGAGALVGVCMPRSRDMVAVLLGIFKAQAAYVPIDPAYPLQRIHYMLADSGAGFIITHSSLKALIPAQATTMFIDQWQEKSHQLAGTNLAGISSSQLAYLIYTSGSTGMPKGVMITHSNVSSFLQWCQQEFAEDRFSIVYAATSICFDLSIFEIFYTLTTGKSIRILSSALEIPHYLTLDKQVLINTVPSVMTELLHTDADLDRVSVINLAGEPIPVSLAERLRRLPVSLRNLYGPSEDTTYSTVYRLAREEEKILIGRPIHHTQILILDERGELSPIGVAGEIHIGGAGLSKGYWGQPELTSQKFIPHRLSHTGRIYKTGDAGRWLADGNIEFLGRLDHQVKIRGYRIELGEIESQLMKHPDVKNVAVLTRKNEADSYLVAYYVSSDKQVPHAELAGFLSMQLPDYMVPHIYVQLQHIPLTPNGKLDRKALPHPDRPAFEKVLPVNDTEAVLIDIWADILKLDKNGIGRTDSFFELGGHSLKVIVLVNRIEKELNIKIPLKDVFTKQTIKKLADYILTVQPQAVMLDDETEITL